MEAYYGVWSRDYVQVQPKAAIRRIGRAAVPYLKRTLNLVDVEISSVVCRIGTGGSRGRQGGV